MTLFDFFYKNLFRPVLFKVDPERIHDWMMHLIPLSRPIKPLIKPFLSCKHHSLKRQIWGLTFENPVGLAGGFDKDAECVDLWDMFGFGFVELGTVTPKPQPGNPKPRLFRYPEMKALINRMGFNNDGAEAIAARLRRNKEKGHVYPGVTGISIGKQFSTLVEDIDQVIKDYITSLEILYPYTDFFAVNVSSPNTKNLRALQQVASLDKLVTALIQRMEELCPEKRKPLCVKFAPDLEDDDIKAATDVLLKRGVDGVIATNTTNKTGELEQGGMSGAPLRERSTAVIRLISGHTGGIIPIIGCGGIFTVEDAIEKLQAGASLVQIYTGFVYNGPTAVKQICEGIIERK